MSTCTHHSALQFPSSLILSHKTSCPFPHTTDDPWSISAGSKLFSLPLTALCSDNHSLESLLRSRKKNYPAITLSHFMNILRSNFCKYFKFQANYIFIFWFLLHKFAYLGFKVVFYQPNWNWERKGSQKEKGENRT